MRRMRYIFDLSDADMIAVFRLADLDVKRAQIIGWLKKDDDPAFQQCTDIQFATFLNGFISKYRGRKEGEQPKPEQRLTNNIIFRKFKIALDLKAEDILEIMKRTNMRISKHELSAFFRKSEHKNYRECKDQVLRNFITGLQIKYRGDSKPDTNANIWGSPSRSPKSK